MWTTAKIPFCSKLIAPAHILWFAHTRVHNMQIRLSDLESLIFEIGGFLQAFYLLFLDFTQAFITF